MHICTHILCVCLCMKCVKCELHVPWYVYGDQKIISRVSPHLPPCLRQGLFLFSVAFSKLACRQAIKASPSPLLISQYEHCDYKCTPPHPALCGFGGSRLRFLYLCGKLITTKSSPHPSIFLILSQAWIIPKRQL